MMNEFLIVAKEKREQKEKEAAAAAKAEKKAMAKYIFMMVSFPCHIYRLQKTRASLLASHPISEAAKPVTDITYGDGGSTARSSIIKPKPDLEECMFSCFYQLYAVI